MKSLTQQLRLLLCEQLLHLVMFLLPKDHPDGQLLLWHIREYALTRITHFFQFALAAPIEDDVAALLAEVKLLRGYNEDLNLELAACDQKLRAFRKELKPGREPHA